MNLFTNGFTRVVNGLDIGFQLKNNRQPIGFELASREMQSIHRVVLTFAVFAQINIEYSLSS